MEEKQIKNRAICQIEKPAVVGAHIRIGLQSDDERVKENQSDNAAMEQLGFDNGLHATGCGRSIDALPSSGSGMSVEGLVL